MTKKKGRTPVVSGPQDLVLFTLSVGEETDQRNELGGHDRGCDAVSPCQQSCHRSNNTNGGQGSGPTLACYLQAMTGNLHGVIMVQLSFGERLLSYRAIDRGIQYGTTDQDDPPLEPGTFQPCAERLRPFESLSAECRAEHRRK